MHMAYRILICLGILLIDLAVFFLPLTALFLAYIILANPPWFREFLQKLNHDLKASCETTEQSDPP